MARTRYIIRDNPAGDPEASVTVTVKTAAGATLDTPATDGDGIATYEQDGSPGPMVAQATVGSRTIKRDGRSLDQLGTWFPNDAPVFWRSLGNGIIPGYSDPDTAANDMAVSPGTGLQVTVASGACLIDGHTYRCTASTNLTIDANASGSTRYDRVVVRFTREGQTAEGKCELVILKGTPGAGDGAALTRSSSTYEVSIAKVRVVDSAASLVSGDLTDERYNTALYQAYIPVNPNAFAGSTASYTAGDLFYIDAAGKWARLAKGTDGQLLKLASGIPSWATQTFTVTVQEGDVTVDANVSTLDFDASDFNVTSSPSGEANVALAYGTSAGTPAEGDHTHSGVYAAVSHTHTLSAVTDVTASAAEVNLLDGVTASTAEINYLDGVTSNIQTQLDSKGTGGGNVTGAASSVDSEVVLFSGTGGKTLKRSSLTAGLVKSTSGILSAAGASDMPVGINATAIGAGTVSSTEFGYLDGVTSGIQAQLDSKASASATYTHAASVRQSTARDEVASGTANVTSTSGQVVTGLYADITLTNGAIYDVLVTGGASVTAPSGGYIYTAAVIDSAGTPTVSSFNGEGTETGSKWHGGSVVVGVTGTGSSIRCGLWFKVSTGTGTVGSGHMTVLALPRAVS